MKNILILLLLVSSAAFAHAQNGETASSDTTRIMSKRKMIEIIRDSTDESSTIKITKINGDSSRTEEDEDKPDNFDVDLIGGLDIGLALYMHDNSLNYPASLSALDTKIPNSTAVNLHLLSTRIGMFKSHLNLCTGLDFDNLQMAFANPTLLVPNTDSLTWFSDTVNSYRKSKLTMRYLQVPLMLKFVANPEKANKSFRIAVGGYYGILVNSFTKTKTESGDKVITRDDFSLNKMRYGITGRIGIGSLEAFCNYNLSTLFREDQAPEITPITVGLSIGSPW